MQMERGDFGRWNGDALRRAATAHADRVRIELLPELGIACELGKVGFLQRSAHEGAEIRVRRMPARQERSTRHVFETERTPRAYV